MSARGDELKAMSQDQLIDEVLRLEVALTQTLKGGGESLEMVSGAREDGKPFITMTWGTETGQLSPSEARLHALRMLEVAEGAESDGVTVSFLRDQGADAESIASFLMMQRDYRGRLKERWRGGNVPDGA